MNNIINSSTKVYLRYREGHPETILQSSAYHGFTNLGAEVVPFYWIDDIDTFEDLGPETMVVGYIGDVQRGLRKLGKPIPQALDYPHSLRHFLGRDIEKTTLGKVRLSTKQLFVKPIEQKAFTGFVWEGSNHPVSRRRVVMHDDTTEVYTSQVLNMVSEYRAMILHGQILDVRRYKGDWSLAPNKEFVEKAVHVFEASGEALAAYTLDFAVVQKDFDGNEFPYTGKTYSTVLVEANDGYAFGNYGLLPEAYVSCLAARWKQMVL